MRSERESKEERETEERKKKVFIQPGDYFNRKKIFEGATVNATVFSISREVL